MDIYDKEDFETLAAHLIREYDYIFYVSPEGVEIEDNGVRETDAQYRNTIDNMINTLINKYNHRIKKFHTLEGSTEDRIHQVVNYMNL